MQPKANGELRKFGMVLGGGIAGLFGTLFPLLSHHPLAPGPWIMGAVFLLCGLFIPQCLKIIYHPWMKLGHLLGWINTRIILGIIYFLIITPIAIILRIRGKDLMQRQYHASADTYRKVITPPPIQHMERPF